jgi:2-polyprenyl-3-methyl-5-hydroxy-6-metoxy-1,4-benzoquinol methylase
MSSHAVTAAAGLHADGVAAFEAGDEAGAADLLAQAAKQSLDSTVLNDLAVVLAALGETERARALLTTCLTLDESDADAVANLELLDDQRSWRSSPTIAGDEDVPERAYPGMPLALTMSEHAMRYSMALGVLPGSDFLDVGCGTGYGSEMLTWRGGRVRGFDLWQPAEHERPRWSGGAELTYGFDVTKDELPAADAAVMFEVLEHLDDGPAALRNVFNAVDTLLVSFPNPTHHGSHLNPHHVNDWPLERVEEELMRAAATRFAQLKTAHMYQPQGLPTILSGREPEAPFWIILAQGVGEARTRPAGRRLTLPR